VCIQQQREHDEFYLSECRTPAVSSVPLPVEYDDDDCRSNTDTASETSACSPGIVCLFIIKIVFSMVVSVWCCMGVFVIFGVCVHV